MKYPFLLVAIALLMPISAHATEDSYTNVTDIPYLLLERLAPVQYEHQYPSESEERYVAGVLNILQSLKLKGTDLTTQIVEDDEKQEIRYKLKWQLHEAMHYDKNFDEKVTEQEIRDTLVLERHFSVTVDPAKAKEVVESAVVKLMTKYDANHDGVIMAKETAIPPVLHHSAWDMRSVLELDPNGDGKLTAAELEDMAHKAFLTVDRDGDGTLNKDEMNTVYSAVRLKKPKDNDNTRPSTKQP